MSEPIIERAITFLDTVPDYIWDRRSLPVPIEKIVARHARAIGNLAPAIALADRTYVYDNSVEDVEARLCARTQDGLLRKIYGPLPVWVAEAVLPLELHRDFVDVRAA